MMAGIEGRPLSLETIVFLEKAWAAHIRDARMNYGSDDIPTLGTIYSTIVSIRPMVTCLVEEHPSYATDHSACLDFSADRDDMRPSLFEFDKYGIPSISKRRKQKHAEF